MIAFESQPPARIEECTQIARAQAGDQEAVGWLYNTYIDRIYRYIYLRVGQIELAEDLTSVVFLRMITALPRFTPQPDAGFAAWLYRIASNAVIDHYRKQGGSSFTDLESTALAIADPTPDPLRVVEHQEDVVALRQAIQRLTPLQAQVIMLRFGSNLPSASVAQILGRSVGAVKALQHAALRRLAQDLDSLQVRDEHMGAHMVSGDAFTDPL